MGTSKTTWHAQRTQGIGGSEIAAVLGLDPYETPYSVWEKKTGRVPPFEGNAATERGNLLEPAIVAFFEKASGHKAYAFPKNKVLRHPEHPFLLGTPDRGVALKSGDGILECKSTRKAITADTIPLGWLFQVQWYLGITGRKRGFLAWIGGSLEFDWREVEASESIFQDMAAEAAKFWNDYVLTDTPPPPIRKEDIEKMFPDVQAGTVEATPQLIEVCAQYGKNRSKIKELEEAQSELAQAIQLHLLDKDTLTAQGVTLATWKESVKKAYTVKESKIRTLRVKDLGF